MKAKVVKKPKVNDESSLKENKNVPYVTEPITNIPEEEHDRFRGDVNPPRIICIIPARSGSKGLTDKNIKPLHGKPLVWHTIEAVKNCGVPIQRILVSTDSQQYADIIDGWCGKGYVPFLRPGDLAYDSTPTYDVVMFNLNRLEEKYDVVLLLEPTSPLRTSQQITESLEQLFRSKYRALVSVVNSEQCHPVLAFKMGRDGQLQPFDGSEYPAHPRRQALGKAYFMDGSIYISFVDTYSQEKCFDHKNTLAYEVEPWQAIEVDYDYDLIQVDALLTWRKGIK